LVVRSDAPRWGWIFFAAAAVFIASAAVVSFAGVTPFERRFYTAVTTAVPNALVFRTITRLGSATVLLPASLVLVALLPRQFLRRWWVWVIVMLLVSTLEGLGKVGIGRPRPGGMRLGFPSGHTAAAAAFYGMACYFFVGVVPRWGRSCLYGAAAGLVLIVGLSRMVLRVHWPLDVLGGAALGIAVLAAAAWWHERYPVDLARAPSPISPARRRWIHARQNVLSLGLVAVLFLSPPMAAANSLFERVLDVAGAVFMLAGLLLRLWAAAHAGRQGLLRVRPPDRLVTTGPYAVMRHPLSLANLLTGVGVVLMAESGLGLVLIPAALVALYRLTVPFEDAHLAERFGREYADYRARVPAFAPPTRATLAAARSALRAEGPVSWRSVVWALPTVAVTLALALLAEVSEGLPRLLR
jgi:protein-S-isoprenylcysteine O-methyltransferase Ste14